jgi:hypothetical protein
MFNAMVYSHSKTGSLHKKNVEMHAVKIYCALLGSTPRKEDAIWGNIRVIAAKRAQDGSARNELTSLHLSLQLVVDLEQKHSMIARGLL